MIIYHKFEPAERGGGGCRPQIPGLAQPWRCPLLCLLCSLALFVLLLILLWLALTIALSSLLAVSLAVSLSLLCVSLLSLLLLLVVVVVSSPVSHSPGETLFVVCCDVVVSLMLLYDCSRFVYCLFVFLDLVRSRVALARSSFCLVCLFVMFIMYSVYDSYVLYISLVDCCELVSRSPGEALFVVCCDVVVLLMFVYYWSNFVDCLVVFLDLVRSRAALARPSFCLVCLFACYDYYVFGVWLLRSVYFFSWLL